MATNLATDGPSVIFKPVVWTSELARLAGFEPATRCLEGTVGQSPKDAVCGLTCSFPYSAVAGCGLR